MWRWLAVLVAAGCPERAPESSETASLRFDMDVVVRDGYVAVWLREQFDTGCGPEEIYPRPGESAETTDAFWCQGGTLALVCSLRVEAGGAIVGATEPGFLDRWWHWLTVEAAVADGAELVMELCDGETIRVPLPTAAPPPVTLLDLTYTGEHIGFTLEGGSAIAGLGGGYGGPEVHGANHVSVPWSYGGAPLTAYVEAVASGGVYETARGVAHTWASRFEESVQIVVPEDPDDDGFRELFVDGDITAVHDGAAVSSWVQSLRFAGDLLAFGYYTAGPVDDTLVVDVDGERYSATIPHIEPIDPLDFSLDGNDTIAVSIPETVLTSDLDPTRTRTLAVELSVTHRVVPRPE